MNVSSRVLGGWYVKLAPRLEAGLSLAESIGAVAGPSRESRTQLQAALVAGQGVEAALASSGMWLPEVDRHLLGAGARVGRLPDVCRRLAARHEETVKAGRQALMAVLYPLFIAHFAVVVLPVSEWFTGGGVGVYLWKVARVLVPGWMVGALGWLAVRQRWRVATAVLEFVPFVAGYRRFRALADFTAVIEAQWSAGVRPDVAWLLAAKAAGDPRLEPLAIAVAEGVQHGEAVSAQLAGRTELPDVFLEFYANGEKTGRLDESLAHVRIEFQEQARSRLRLATIVYPALLFAAVAAAVAYKVLSFWLGYFRQLDQIQ